MNLETKYTVASGTTGNLLINFTFDWINESDVKVYKGATPFTDWQFITRTQIVITSGNYNTGDVFTVRRETSTDNAVVQFNPGGSIRAQDLNRNQTQVFNVIEEFNERKLDLTGVNEANASITASGNRVGDLSQLVAKILAIADNFEYR